MNMRFAVLLIVASLVASGCSQKDDASVSTASTMSYPRVAVTPVRRGDLSAKIELVGNLLPSQRTIIVAEVDGVIERIAEPSLNPISLDVDGRQMTLPLGIGSQVFKDDLLMKLDASDYQRGLAVAEAQLEKLKADLARLLAWQRPEEVARTRALYEEAQAKLANAESEFDRVESLQQTRAVTESEYEDKKTELFRSRAMLAHAKANLDIAEAGPTAEEIAVAKAAMAAAEAEVDHKRWKVEKTSILAPYDGVVTERYLSVGDRVTAMPRVEMMELMDVSFLAAEVGVPEKYSGKVQILQQASVLVQGMAEATPGLILRINDKVDPGSRTFRIRIAIKNDQRRFRVGQFARVYLDVATSQGVLTIPRQAVTYAGGQPQVFVYSSQRVELKPVSLGIADEVAVEVLSGLQEGQQVVVDDPAILTDGMQVELRPQPVAHRSRGVSPR